MLSDLLGGLGNVRRAFCETLVKYFISIIALHASILLQICASVEARIDNVPNNIVQALLRALAMCIYRTRVLL